MDPLVSNDDFSRASGVRNKVLVTGIMKFAGLDRLNDLYSSLYDYQGLDFISGFFRQSNIILDIDPQELERIPANGSFITVSNHPYGGVDGLALLELIARRRNDYKVMANFLLKKIRPIEDFFIGVNPFETHKHVASSTAGMKQAFNHLQQGMPLGIFPAGEVSTRQPKQSGIVDREWQKSALKLIHKANVPVIPVYFHGANSWSFHMLGRIHPMLRTLRLPHELTSRKPRVIKVRIGMPITVKEQSVFQDADTLGKFLRSKTYSLGSSLGSKKSFWKSFKIPAQPAKIVDGSHKSIIANEVASITDLRVHAHENYEVYLAESHRIPTILKEIGRLREITFRKQGEGTNKRIDLDKFDNYYHHLFLYDRDTGEICGAYRVGMGRSILRDIGTEGFYTNTLFRMSDEFDAVLGNAIELGRSFIVPEYQRKRLPLFLLWQGILHVLRTNPDYKYIVGPVSISNAYTNLSKSLLVAFIQRYYMDHQLASFIRPRKEYQLKDSVLQDAEALLASSGNDLRKLDRIIQDIEPAIKSAPVLLKKYIQQNARIIGFNVDPDFNEALDGLMVLTIKDLPGEHYSV